MFKIIEEPKNGQQWCDLANMHSSVYTSDTHRYIHLGYSPFDSSLTIQDISNAFKTGADCIGFSLNFSTTTGALDFIQDCHHNVTEVLSRCVAELEKCADSDSASFMFDDASVNIYLRKEKGTRTFSPLPEQLKTLKPLKEIPKKWTLRHAIRLLGNQQFSSLSTSARYTDDYAMDAAYDFYKGDLDHLDLLKDLTQSPSGWWVSGAENDGDVLGISCHHFDYKNCTVDLERKHAKQAAAPEQESDSDSTPGEGVSSSEALKAPAGILMGAAVRSSATIH